MMTKNWLTIPQLITIVIILSSTDGVKCKNTDYLYDKISLTVENKSAENQETDMRFLDNLKGTIKSLMFIPNTISQLLTSYVRKEWDIHNAEYKRLNSAGRNIVKNVQKQIKRIEQTFLATANDFITNKTFYSILRRELKRQLKLIIPGTKWCGSGDKAKTYEDLGIFQSSDKCCRDHDNCPESIPPGEKRYGLSNTGIFTRSSCYCDTKFYNCLKNVSTVVAKNIGFTFFTLLNPQCFEEYVAVLNDCKPNESNCTFSRESKDYNEHYRWKDNPNF